MSDSPNAPTPDAVRDALVRVFDAANVSARPLVLNDLADALGMREYSHRSLADATLALRVRRLPSGGEHTTDAEKNASYRAGMEHGLALAVEQSGLLDAFEKFGVDNITDLLDEVRTRALATPEPSRDARGEPVAMMSLRHMQEVNTARSVRWMAGSPGWTTLEVAGELAGEVGELANVCKKIRRSEMGVPGNKVSDAELRAQARGEIADVLIVLMLTAAKLGIDLQDAVCETFNAKSEQMGFPERFAAPPAAALAPVRAEGEGT